MGFSLQVISSGGVEEGLCRAATNSAADVEVLLIPRNGHFFLDLLRVILFHVELLVVVIPQVLYIGFSVEIGILLAY